MIPPGMGAAEYAAYCRAKADPAELQAIRDWAHQHFGRHNRPKDCVQPSRRPPNSHVTSDRNETVIGLPSPSASEHGQPDNRHKDDKKTFNGIRPRQAAAPTPKAPSDLVLHLVTNGKVKKQTSNRQGSEQDSKGRGQRRSTARVTRSKVESLKTFLQLDASGKKAMEARSINLLTETEGKEDAL